MARFGLRNRLAKLESRRNKQGAHRVLFYSPAAGAQGAAGDFPGLRLGGYQPAPKNATAGKFDPLPGRYMLAPDFGTDKEWADALRVQQLALLAKASNVGAQSTNKGE